MARMRAAALHDIDPQTVEPERAREIESAILGERRNMAIQLLDQIGNERVALRQVVERGVGCIAFVTVRAGPALPGAIVGSERPAAMAEFLQQGGIIERALIEKRREQAARGHSNADRARRAGCQ